jgi:hypothetical protein
MLGCLTARRVFRYRQIVLSLSHIQELHPDIQIAWAYAQHHRHMLIIEVLVCKPQSCQHCYRCITIRLSAASLQYDCVPRRRWTVILIKTKYERDKTISASAIHQTAEPRPSELPGKHTFTIICAQMLGLSRATRPAASKPSSWFLPQSTTFNIDSSLFLQPLLFISQTFAILPIHAIRGHSMCENAHFYSWASASLARWSNWLFLAKTKGRHGIKMHPRTAERN